MRIVVIINTLNVILKDPMGTAYEILPMNRGSAECWSEDWVTMQTGYQVVYETGRLEYENIEMRSRLNSMNRITSYRVV